MPDARAKVESLDAQNLRAARLMLKRPDMYPEGSIGHQWAMRVLDAAKEQEAKRV